MGFCESRCVMVLLRDPRSARRFGEFLSDAIRKSSSRSYDRMGVLHESCLETVLEVLKQGPFASRRAHGARLVQLAFGRYWMIATMTQGSRHNLYAG